MRTGQPIIGRPASYDRNPIPQLERFGPSYYSPHADTQRWTYTVPPLKKAFVELIHTHIHRRTAATTAALAYVEINFQPSGGITYTLLRTQIRTNNVGDKDKDTIGQNILMFAGDLMECRSSDGSTGGDIDMLGVAKITEFDA